MDNARFREVPSSFNGYNFEHRTSSFLSSQHLGNNSVEQNHQATDPDPPPLLLRNADATTCGMVSSLGTISKAESADDGLFYNAVFKYINDMLMEEDLEGQNFMLQDSLALQATEKSFSDVLTQPYSTSLPVFPRSSRKIHTPDVSSCSSSSISNTSNTADSFVEFSWIFDDQAVESSLGTIHQVADSREYSYSFNGSRERKIHMREASGNIEGRSNKHSAISHQKAEENEILDEILLSQAVSTSCVLHNDSQNGARGKLKQMLGKTKGCNTRTTSSKKQGKEKEVVDLYGLLSRCAQAVATNNNTVANEVLRQIRLHSSRLGDGNQRLAHYFANGLEARLTGTGTPGYTPIMSSKISAADILKAFQAYVAAVPFKKMSDFIANQTISKLAEKATRLHIIDFGILYGFQWPCLVEQLSTRPGGPPKLRITGIDLPQRGFRPAERVEATGRRLRKFCERFGVPFEFNAIAQKWETIKYEDLKIDTDEMLVVNCAYRFLYLPDDTMAMKSPRDTVLRLINRMNPDIFIFGVMNGTYNAPYFIRRFGNALYFFSSFFDLIDATIPREVQERVMIESEIFGRYAINVIACEGGERLERPETYKQWQVRCSRAGLRQLPPDEEMLKKVRSIVKSQYNKDFVVDEDDQWMLQGWKGRILCALSFWKPGH